MPAPGESSGQQQLLGGGQASVRPPLAREGNTASQALASSRLGCRAAQRLPAGGSACARCGELPAPLTLHLALGVDNHAGVVLKVDVGTVLPPERLALPHHDRGHHCGQQWRAAVGQRWRGLRGSSRSRPVQWGRPAPTTLYRAGYAQGCRSSPAFPAALCPQGRDCSERPPALLLPLALLHVRQCCCACQRIATTARSWLSRGSSVHSSSCPRLLQADGGGEPRPMASACSAAARCDSPGWQRSNPPHAAAAALPLPAERLQHTKVPGG